MFKIKLTDGIREFFAIEQIRFEKINEINAGTIFVLKPIQN